MLTIRAHFARLTDISLVDAYDEIGVYVLWSSRATVRPSYIGEGNVLKRFVDHMGKTWAARPIHGSMAFISEGTPRQQKWSAELVEAALLDVADMTNRYPANNVMSGKRGSLNRLLERRDHNVGVIRITVSGQDPLHPPERSPMRADKRITFRIHPDGFWHIAEHDWNQRS